MRATAFRPNRMSFGTSLSRSIDLPCFHRKGNRTARRRRQLSGILDRDVLLGTFDGAEMRSRPASKANRSCRRCTTTCRCGRVGSVWTAMWQSKLSPPYLPERNSSSAQSRPAIHVSPRNRPRRPMSDRVVPHPEGFPGGHGAAVGGHRRGSRTGCEVSVGCGGGLPRCKVILLHISCHTPQHPPSASFSHRSKVSAGAN